MLFPRRGDPDRRLVVPGAGNAIALIARAMILQFAAFVTSLAGSTRRLIGSKPAGWGISVLVLVGSGSGSVLP